MRIITTVLCLLLLAACDEPTTTTDSTTDSIEDVTPDVPLDESDPEPDGPPCNLPDTPCTAPDSTCFETPCTPPSSPTCIAGHVIDEASDPLLCQGVVACTAGTCYPGNTDEEGFFAVTIPATGISDLAIYFPGSPRHSPFCRWDDLCDGEMRICDPFMLRAAPTSGTAVPYDPPASPPTLTEDIRIEGDDAAVILPTGAELKMPIGAEPWMALSSYPLTEDTPCFIDPADPPLALYVVTPYDVLVIEPGSRFDPVLIQAGLDLPNTTSLPADTVVDIYVLGGVHPDSAGLHEGEWAALTTATVTSDGTRIQTDDTEGIGYLTWFGVYEAP